MSLMISNEMSATSHMHLYWAFGPAVSMVGSCSQEPAVFASDLRAAQRRTDDNPRPRPNPSRHEPRPRRTRLVSELTLPITLRAIRYRTFPFGWAFRPGVTACLRVAAHACIHADAPACLPLAKRVLAPGAEDQVDALTQEGLKRRILLDSEQIQRPHERRREVAHHGLLAITGRPASGRHQRRRCLGVRGRRRRRRLFIPPYLSETLA